MKFSVAFRVDASNEIGSGHVMRCLTLANILRERGAECLFICREHPGNMLEWIRKQGFIVIALPVYKGKVNFVDEAKERPLTHAVWLGSDWQMDAQQTKIALGGAIVDWLIVDHYAIDERWETSLDSNCRKIMVIDDLADRVHNCELLIDQNLVPNKECRYNGKTPNHCVTLIGPKYALLQPQYAKLHSCTSHRTGLVRRMLVYFGGADEYNLTGKTVSAFIRIGRSDIKLDVVVNHSSPYFLGIQQMIVGHTNVTLNCDLPSLAKIMSQSDLAIGACGATTWERCCLGLPTLVVTLAENQKLIATELNRLGVINLLGHKDQVDETELMRSMNEYLNKELNPEWSELCKNMVDGLGAKRVASVLMLNSETKLKARAAKQDDELLYLQWANDKLVRQNAFSSAMIENSNHNKWFKERINKNENFQLFVIETEDGIALGQVRFERTKEGWEIDYSLDAKMRGQGLAKSIVKTAIEIMKTRTEKVLLIGRVKYNNLNSQKVFKHLNFKNINNKESIKYYKKI